MTRAEKLKQKFFEILDSQIISDTSHRVALGCALGIVINFFPTLGIGFLVAFLLAAFFKANRPSAAAASLLTAPVIPLMYTINLGVGGLILTPATGKENLTEFVLDQYAIMLSLGNINEKIFSFLDFFGTTFILGAVVNAAIFGIVCYYLVERMLKKRAL